MPRTRLIGLILVTTLLSLGCSRVVTGPSFKSQVPQGGTFFGEVYSPMSVTNTGVLKVSTGEDQGYFLVTALDGQLFTYDLKTGKRLDKKPLARLPKGVRSAPYFDTTNKHLIVGCYDQMVHALDINTGAVHWRAPVGGYVQASPVLSDGVVVIGTTNGKVYGIAPIDGSIKWQVDVDGAVFGAAGVNPEWPNRALVGTSEGTGFLIDTQNGKSIGDFKAGSPLHAAPAIVAINNEVVAYCSTMDGGLIAYNLPASGMSGVGSQRWTGIIGTAP
ncbi:MAG: PQQ-binding-like beta-propeller repeat protein, partial [bacterium]